MSTGLIRYALTGPSADFPPLWLVSLWLVFGTLLNTLFARLHGHWLWQALLAFGGAPLSYLSGVKLGAMDFVGPPWKGLLAIAVVWTIAFPVLMAIAYKIDKRVRAR